MRWLVVCLVIIAGALGLVIWRGQSPEAGEPGPAATTTPVLGPQSLVIGTSVAGRQIKAYTFGSGERSLVFVGGIHGGYEWNSVLLAYQALDFLAKNPKMIPEGLAVTIIPALNPDGVYRVTGREGVFTIAEVSTEEEVLTAGRLNANAVDLNRNFACQWRATGTWRTKTVSAGSAPFSEPEAAALRDFVLKNKPVAVVFWHSQANAIYASACQAEILPETIALMDAYAKASGYPAVKTFTDYLVTGAADDWLASLKIPAFTVELKTHETIEWEQNLAGIKALMEYFKE